MICGGGAGGDVKGMGIGSSIVLMDVAVRSMDEKDLCDDSISMIQRDVFLLRVFDFAVSKQIKGISCVIKWCGYVLMSLSCCHGVLITANKRQAAVAKCCSLALSAIAKGRWLLVRGCQTQLM